MATTTTDYAGQVLTDVRRQIAVDDDVLSETKDRRNLVKRHARSFPGVLKSFDSGSVAHGTVNKPVSDADCGVVLDRRTYPELGPDGEDVSPNDIVWDMAVHVLAGVLEEYPEATFEVCKLSRPDQHGIDGRLNEVRGAGPRDTPDRRYLHARGLGCATAG
ncbi:MAG TPA: hypothetical protein VL972_05450 [Solirubrobacteraceae bacterium]|nr:hypothetical protein [Solirubrobacteraceae bacterium]